MYDATMTTLHASLAAVDRVMCDIDRIAHRAATEMLSATTAQDMLRLYAILVERLGELTGIVNAAPAGFAQYARDQKGAADLDPVAEYLLVKAAIEDVVNTIAASLPVSGGYLQVVTLTATTFEWRTFTPAQTNPVKIKVDILKDLIAS